MSKTIYLFKPEKADQPQLVLDFSSIPFEVKNLAPQSFHIAPIPGLYEGDTLIAYQDPVGTWVDINPKDNLAVYQVTLYDTPEGALEAALNDPKIIEAAWRFWIYYTPGYGYHYNWLILSGIDVNKIYAEYNNQNGEFVLYTGDEEC